MDNTAVDGIRTITHDGIERVLYIPKNEEFTDEDHSDIRQLKQKTGMPVAIDGSQLQFMYVQDAKRLDPEEVVLNPNPALEKQLDLYNSIGASIRTIELR